MDVDLNLIVLIIAVTIVALVAMLKGYEFQMQTKYMNISLTAPNPKCSVLEPRRYHHKP